LFIAT
jgi:actin-related protein 3